MGEKTRFVRAPMCAILKPKTIGTVSNMGLSTSSISDMSDAEFAELESDFQSLLIEVEIATRPEVPCVPADDKESND